MATFLSCNFMFTIFKLVFRFIYFFQVLNAKKYKQLFKRVVAESMFMNANTPYHEKSAIKLSWISQLHGLVQIENLGNTTFYGVTSNFLKFFIVILFTLVQELFSNSFSVTVLLFWTLSVFVCISDNLFRHKNYSSITVFLSSFWVFFKVINSQCINVIIKVH